MPRDATDTRSRLIREAERLFARHGVFQTTVRQIVEAAEQRNASALTYHFGSREGLLRAILLRHNVAIDEDRGRRFVAVGEQGTTRELLGTLLLPYAAPLATLEGRDYLCIVAQLNDAFPDWPTSEDLTGPHLLRILHLLEARPAHVPAPIRRRRIVAAIALMTAVMAERARHIEQGRRQDLDEATFLANLADMLVGLLEAPLGPPLC